MRGLISYLDSSAIVRRYVREFGSDLVREVYLKAYAGEGIVSFSIWNVGEVLGTLDRAMVLRRMDPSSYRKVRARFILGGWRG